MSQVIVEMSSEVLEWISINLSKSLLEMYIVFMVKLLKHKKTGDDISWSDKP